MVAGMLAGSRQNLTSYRKPAKAGLPTIDRMSSTTSSTKSPAGDIRHDATVIGLVGLAHGISHFSQLLLAPLFPWLKDAFGVSYIELGFLMTIFFVVSCSVQAASGFVVDRFGPRPILFAGLGLLAAAAFGFAASQSYAMLAFFSVIAGIGNGVFHPVDFTLLNRKVHQSRLGHAFSVHGITGSLGWGLAPAMLVPLTHLYSWRVALVCAGAVSTLVLVILWFARRELALEPHAAVVRPKAANTAALGNGSFDFLAIPAVWMCFAFFFFYAMALSGVQAFAPEAARILHEVPTQWAGMCLTIYMVCSAMGMVAGGFLAADPTRCERIVGAGFGVAACIALMLGYADLPALAVPVLFGAMGIGAGVAGPSRDLIVKRSAPEGATGRVYGVVYSGLDIGQAVAPLVFGALMDGHKPAQVWLGIAIVQGVLIASAFNVRRVRRTVLAPA
jgi:MFS transporter, FSR family, fosmidomycin resistance protein